MPMDFLAPATNAPRGDAQMAAGELDKWLVIQQPADPSQRDTFGQPIGEPTIFAETWGSVEPLSGSESVKGDQPRATATHRVVIRYRDGLRSGMHVIHAGRTLEITTFRDIKERRWRLEIFCSELQP